MPWSWPGFPVPSRPRAHTSKTRKATLAAAKGGLPLTGRIHPTRYAGYADHEFEHKKYNLMWQRCYFCSIYRVCVPCGPHTSFTSKRAPLMAEIRTVTHTRKGDNGSITHLGNPDEDWRFRRSKDVIRDISSGEFEYCVKTDIHVAGTGNGKYLRTDADSTTHNNLSKLPDC